MTRTLVTITICGLLSLLLGCATTPASRDIGPQEMPAELNAAAAAKPASDLDAEITALLVRYADAFSRQDNVALFSLWDRTDPDVFYIAEEIDPPMHGWKLIEAYFNRPGVLEDVRYRFSDVRAQLLTPDLAIATYNMRFEFKLRKMKPMAGFDRVVVVFRRKEGAWKFARYIEAPQAPLTMVRKLGRTAKTVTPEQLQQVLRTIQTLQEDAVPPDFANRVP